MDQPAAYAEVVVEIADRKLDRPFHYSIPEELRGQVQPGVRVQVSFGSRNLEGFVIGISPQAPVDETKPISRVLEGEPLISADLLALARWMAGYYMCPLVTVLQAFLPGKGQVISAAGEKWCSPAILLTEEDKEKIRRRAPKQGLILDLLGNGELPVKDLLGLAETDRRPLQSLVNKGLVKTYLRQSPEEPAQSDTGALRQRFVLTLEQRRALESIESSLGQNRHQVFLLHGVTGSGKTEVYLCSLERVLELGYQAIVLFPEISLTTHLVDRFQERFGNAVEVLHSGLSLRKRHQAWHRIQNGQASIVIGARSAVFAPVRKLGLIIIDEEHENSYQQDVNPKYHAREVALQRGILNRAPVILGSATPSLESYFQAQQGNYQLLVLANRVEKQPLPKVRCIDLRQELREGNKGIFSDLLQQKMEHCFTRGEQVILFLNRRGYASFLVCRDCGHTIKCKKCDVSLTYHAGQRVLKCHYCGYNRSLPGNCPHCGGSRVRPCGIGTERVEREVRNLFPTINPVRIDTDTTRRKGDYERALGLFETGKADLMIGTQMVAKGLDFPNVTLVGVILADLTLNFPDFRSRERTFQLLTQVADRAGRGAIPGEVIVQTYNPEDPTIMKAASHDYRSFYQEEIELRRLLGYPPFCHLLRILVTGEKEESCASGCRGIAERVHFLKSKNGLQLEVLGPSPAPLSKINNQYRWQLVLKSEELDLLRKLVVAVLRGLARESALPRGIRLGLDVNPIGML
jgi:primosomal protein N' (replication factor Y)